MKFYTDITKEISEIMTSSDLSDLLESLYYIFNYTPIFFEKDTQIPSIREHYLKGYWGIQVIFSFEDQWMKQSHQFGESLFETFADMFRPVNFEEMKIKKAQSRIRTTAFNEQIGLS